MKPIKTFEFLKAYKIASVAMSLVFIIGIYFFTEPGKQVGMLVSMGAFWIYLLVIMFGFKLEVYEERILYKNFLKPYEIVFSNVATFYSGECKSVWSRPMALDVRMKPGVSPSRHLIAFIFIGEEAGRQISEIFRAKGIEEIES